MTFSNKIYELQVRYPQDVILIKNGIFFVAVGRDALFLNENKDEELIFKNEGNISNPYNSKSNKCNECNKKKETENDVIERLKSLNKN